MDMKREQIEELLYQALETEMGGVKVYETAIRCAQNDELREEWTEYHEQTQNHERIMRSVCEQFGLDLNKETPGRKVVRLKGQALIQAMEMALKSGDPAAAQIVAAECVVDAETKDHMNWELIGQVAEKLKGDEKKVLQEAHDEVEDEEDEHLYHTMGWARELWIESLGLPAVLPPPEEEKDVKTAIGAARAKQARTEMLHGKREHKKAS
jgi:rubrerythrin